ncbi:MAG TPA: redox-sensing transcriptional repressor Rex [Bacteroidales bacterium]|jgi:redox-sensing transcriptional repressor|nr:redox-sensing transcriptional repressor Rex [Bacteroidales bacterium]
MKKLPEKTVERLSQYRRALNNCLADGKNRIYSHELAVLLNITAVQVRRDIMFIGYSSTQRKGYDIKDLTEVISKIIDNKEALNVAVVGYGNLGKAIATYFLGNRPKLNLVAAFDIDPKKIGKTVNNIPCYSMDRLREIVAMNDITIAILTVPVSSARDMAKVLVQTGIKGILNFTTVNLNLSDDIYLEEYDMITSLEKVAYFVKHRE